MSDPLCVYCSRRHPEDIRVEGGIRLVSCPYHPPEGFTALSPAVWPPPGQIPKEPFRFSLAFTPPEGPEERMAALEGRLASAEALVAKLEWGSCDGCGHGGYCPICRKPRMRPWSESDDDDEKPGDHAPGCPVRVHREATP